MKFNNIHPSEVVEIASFLGSHFGDSIQFIEDGKSFNMLLKFKRDEIVNALPQFDEEAAYDRLLQMLQNHFNRRYYWCVKDDNYLWLDRIV
jgi:alanine-alpha-ketoisovalerate/valine-pyruvate aminotransferase